MAKKKYNHAFTIAFSVDSDNDGENCTAEELLNALKKRVAQMEADDEVIEATGKAYDSYEN